nr:MAG TPA: hypothetical protein [Caudoviricetes sp.]
MVHLLSLRLCCSVKIIHLICAVASFYHRKNGLSTHKELNF